jgi:hypothetical protein
MLFVVSSAAAQDWLRTGTGLGEAKPRIAVADFAPRADSAKSHSALFTQVVRDDLQFSGILEGPASPPNLTPASGLILPPTPTSSPSAISPKAPRKLPSRPGYTTFAAPPHKPLSARSIAAPPPTPRSANSPINSPTKSSASFPEASPASPPRKSPSSARWAPNGRKSGLWTTTAPTSASSRP